MKSSPNPQNATQQIQTGLAYLDPVLITGLMVLADVMTAPRQSSIMESVKISLKSNTLSLSIPNEVNLTEFYTIFCSRARRDRLLQVLV